MIANLVFCAWHAKGDGGRGTVILLVVAGKCICVRNQKVWYI
eukprot:COSAG03_NODE_855_length_5608_cov_8.978581_5_plen_42_part_00